MSEDPALSARARGWLRFVHRKATTGDDWSSAGRPADWWDDLSTAPVLDFARFDLSESSYALALMADTTPAWRETYAEVLDGLVSRHVTHWAAIDWLTQIGHDPDRDKYTAELAKLWLPPDSVGTYDMPGWTANGVDPWGLQPDPVGADGNLFFKGWLNLMIGFYEYVSGDDKWNSEFMVTGIDDAQFSWTHDTVNALLHRQWQERPEGPHCENTKVWPYCLSAAGLGLRMHDVLRGGDSHSVFDNWVDVLQRKFIGRDSTGPVEWMALYYDPLIDYVHRAGPTAGLSVSVYLLPQDYHLAEVLYRTAVDRIGWSKPDRAVRTLPDPRFLCLGLVLANEFGDDVTFARLQAFAEENFEPAFFGDDRGDFGYWFGYGEPYPRGQLTALLAMVDANEPGGWWRLFNQPNLEKFQQPTVTGVGFPKMGLSRAYNEATGGLLQISTYAATASARGSDTTFAVGNLGSAQTCRVRVDGEEYFDWRAIADDSIEIRLQIDDHDIQVISDGSAARSAGAESAGGLGEGPGQPPDRTASTPAAEHPASRRGVTASSLTLTRASSCPCCPG